MLKRKLGNRVKHRFQKTIVTNLNQICYPPYSSEFEVQAELYKELSIQGFDVRGCVPARCHEGHNRPKVYLDLVVFVDRKPIAIIECKNDDSTDLILKNGTRQQRRYSMFGVPVLKCGCVEAIERVIFKVDDIKYGRSPKVADFESTPPLDAYDQL